MQTTSPRLIAIIAVALSLSACAKTLPDDPKLALACQTKDCICTEQVLPVFWPPETVPILWQANGDAHCPAGYVLQLVSQDE